MSGLSARDTFEERLVQPSAESLARVRETLSSRLTPATVASLEACVRCGLCSDTCHYFLADGDPRSAPAFKAGLVARAYRASQSGGLLGWLRGAAPVDDRTPADWVDTLFGRCTMCGRCTINCVTGVNVPSIVRAARGALASAGFVPPDLQAVVDLALATGNNMGIARDEWIATVRWLEEELQAELDDPAARLPLDQPGARVLYTVNPREAKFFPLSLLAAGSIFHAAGESWTLSSESFDLTNYGLFTGDDLAAGRISERLIEAARALGVSTIVIGECGHGFAANRWLGPEWRRQPQAIEVKSILELVAEYLRSGRLAVDPSRNPRRITLHDPCNLVRHGGIVAEPRAILDRVAADWVEMMPNREQNFCCGGGGGQLSMSRFAKRRLAAGRPKADQIRRTGAAIVAAPCHNCIDQLSEISKEYRLGVEVKTVCEIVADALVTRSARRDGNHEGHDEHEEDRL